MRFELTLLGTNSAVPAYGRYPTAQVLNVQESLFLIDCGEGTQMRINDFKIRHNKIKQAFISHLHGDHIYGLIGLLSSLALNNRKKAFHIYAPEGLEEIIGVQLKYTGALPFQLHFHTVDPSCHQLVFENKKLEVYSLPLDHRIPTCGYLFREKERQRSMRPDKIKAYGIHFSLIPGIKQGNGLTLPNGRIIPNDELTDPPPKPRSYAFCSDTAYNESLVPLIKGVDLLYHESTFCESHAEQALLTKHSTARQAAIIAREAGVGKLILGHYSSRYKELLPFLKEARAVFPNVELGEDGKVVAVPLSR